MFDTVDLTIAQCRSQCPPEAKGVDHGRERGLQQSARVVEEESGERVTPILQPSNEFAACEMRSNAMRGLGGDARRATALAEHTQCRTERGTRGALIR